MLDQPRKQSLLRRLGSWLLLGIPGAFVFFATVPAKDATSNIASWLTYFGVYRIPGFIASRWADFATLLLALSGFALMLMRLFVGVRAVRNAARDGRQRPII